MRVPFAAEPFRRLTSGEKRPGSTRTGLVCAPRRVARLALGLAGAAIASGEAGMLVHRGPPLPLDGGLGSHCTFQALEIEMIACPEIIREARAVGLAERELTLHVRVPMHRWRQWIRHRPANVNEYSSRYQRSLTNKKGNANAQFVRGHCHDRCLRICDSRMRPQYQRRRAHPGFHGADVADGYCLSGCLQTTSCNGTGSDRRRSSG